VKRNVFLTGLLLAPINFFYFLTHLRLDPNPHHDGVVLAAAVANSEYLVPNRDFFTQYGPVATEISGLWLRFTSPTLLQLRLFHVGLLVLIGLLMYWFVASRTKVVLGAVICVLWTVTAPFYILPVATPWPSVILNLILLIAITLACSNKSAEVSKFSLFAIALLLTLSTFLRLQSIVTLVLVFLVLLTYKEFQSLYFTLYGFFTGVALSVLYFFVTNSFSSWVQDCVMWAFDRYATPRSFDKAWLVETSLWLLFPAISAVWFFLFRAWQSSVRLLYVYLLFALLFSILVFLNLIDVMDKSYLNPIYFSQSMAQNWLNWLGYLCSTVLVLISIRFIKKKHFTAKQLVALIIGLSALIQLYPAHDAFHLWWITPVLVIALVGVIDKLIIIRVRPIVFLSVLTIFASLVTQIPYLASPRDYFEAPVLAGMRGDTQSVRVIDQSAKMLSLVPRNSFINFDCVDGLYSVLSGSFQAKDANMVSWGKQRLFSDSEIQYRFTCYTTREVEDLYMQNSFTPISRVQIDEFTSNVLWRK
jgi:hypothetical protein